MRYILLFFSICSLTICGDFAPRKDMGSNILFKTGLKEGKHQFVLTSIEYPTSYKDRVKFFENLNSALQGLGDPGKSKINLIITPEMERDINALMREGWLGEEKMAMKNAEDLTPSELAELDRLNIAVPQTSGEIQKRLNKQYYILLSLMDGTDMYKSDYLYSESDKSILLKSLLLERNDLVDNLRKIERNFVYTTYNGDPNRILYGANGEGSTKVEFVNGNGENGFKVLKDTLVLYVGKDGKKIKNEYYEFSSNIINLKTPKELKESTYNYDSEGVSALLNWERRPWVHKKEKMDSLEKRFSKWDNIEG